MNSIELDREISNTLRNIFEYLGINPSHGHDAEVRTYLERLVKKAQEGEG